MNMELGILNRIDQNLRRNHRQKENINYSEDEDINNSLDSNYLEKENKFYSVTTIDWLNAQARI